MTRRASNIWTEWNRFFQAVNSRDKMFTCCIYILSVSMLAGAMSLLPSRKNNAARGITLEGEGDEEEIRKPIKYRQRGRVWSPICNVVVVFTKRTDNADKISWPARMYRPCPRRVWIFTCSAIGFRPRQNGYLLLRKENG